MSDVKKQKPITGDILLESGTNELELLVFELGGVNYAVNVAKVQELIDGKTAPPIVPIPNSDKRLSSTVHDSSRMSFIFHFGFITFSGC